MKYITDIVVLLCLTLLLAQTASAQFDREGNPDDDGKFDKDGNFIGRTWDEFPGGAEAVCADELDDDTANDDIDEDNDGLIELCYLEDVDAMRHSLSGAELRRKYENLTRDLTRGCLNNSCKGYELVRDLDFNDDDSYISTSTNSVQANWTTGTGWPTIAGTFSGTLEGNGHTLSNLFIDKTLNNVGDNGGFINQLGSGSRIQNLGLSNINVAITISSRAHVTESGLLLVQNWGIITNCYVQGRLEYKLLGFVSDTMSSLVGRNTPFAKISNSYVNMELSENMNTMAGFFIENNRGKISNSYAIGDASKVKSRIQINFTEDNDNEIKHVYYAVSGSSTGRPPFGSPLVEKSRGSPQVINSYWDSTKWKGSDSEPTGSKNVGGFTTKDLQQSTPSTNTAPYYDWITDNWDFGTSSEYPAVKYAKYAPGDTENFNNLACDKSQQPVCGTLLRGQRNNPPTITPPADRQDPITLLEGGSITLNLIIEDADRDPLSVRLDSTDTTVATATIVATDRTNRALTITALDEGMAAITVTVDDGREEANSTDTVTFMVEVKENQPPTLSITLTDQRLQINGTAEITAMVSDANFDVNDSVTLRAMSSTSSVVSVSPPNINGIVDARSETFTLTAHAGGDATITITATDNQDVSVSKTVSVRVNAPPTIASHDSEVTVKAGRKQPINVTVSDVNTEDALTLRLTADSNPNVVELVEDTVTVPTNNMATRAAQTFRIKGLKTGTATLNIAVADDDTTSAMASVEVTVEPNAMPTITIAPDPSALMLLEGTSKTLVVTATDDDDSNFTVTVMSDNSTTATVSPVTASGADYSFTIEAIKVGTVPITVTVDDGRDVPNSIATETFNVEVAANAAPTVEILSQPSQTIESRVTTNVVVYISDANFDLDDRVTLRAVSSTSSVVSVTPEKVNIGSDTNQTFMLTGKGVGESRISFTATDINGEQSTESVLLSVFSSLTLSDNVSTAPEIATVDEAFSLDTSTFFEYDGDDTLSYAVNYAPTAPNWLSFNTATGVLSGTPQVADASTDMDGVSVTVTASDESGGSVPATFKLLINAEPSGTVTISPNNSNKWLLEADTSGVSDANGIDATKTSYQWLKGGTAISGATNNAYTIKDNKEERAGGTTYKVEVTFEDNIGQSVTKSSAVYTVVNEAPVIDTINPATQTVNEDETVSITAEASDANNDDLTYTWSVTSRDRTPSILTGATKTDGQISFDVPADWVVDPSTATGVTETLQLQIEVTEDRDGGVSVTQTAEVVITKIDNDKVDTSISVDQTNLALFTLDEIDLESDSDGENDNPNINYQWQRCPANADCSPQGDWRDITATSRSLTVTDFGGVVGDKFRVKITYTDKQSYRADDFFSIAREYTGRADIKVRAKVFLEGPLQ